MEYAETSRTNEVKQHRFLLARSTSRSRPGRGGRETLSFTSSICYSALPRPLAFLQTDRWFLSAGAGPTTGTSVGTEPALIGRDYANSSCGSSRTLNKADLKPTAHRPMDDNVRDSDGCFTIRLHCT
ncbi:hypothetical protein EVAR_76336_1 [Eumeta japonica]|uniref:Uncharacterized protein n=1 Tax=Eumeta variegata TaxID=151549 RepID=A0A4C1T7K1_EUMVA|nr:hypothetical protein EVAR_76336_1 [Eumeta japonica]